MAPPDPRCTITTKIKDMDVLVTSLSEFSRRYGVNKKTMIIVVSVLEVEIYPEETTLGRCRSFAMEKFDLGGGDIKATIINIRSVKFHTPEPLCPATDCDCGKRTAAATTTTSGDTTITSLVSIRVLKAPVP